MGYREMEVQEMDDARLKGVRMEGQEERKKHGGGGGAALAVRLCKHC